MLQFSEDQILVFNLVGFVKFRAQLSFTLTDPLIQKETDSIVFEVPSKTQSLHRIIH